MSDENFVTLLDDLLSKDYCSMGDAIQPGVAVLVAIDDQIVYQRYIGFANILKFEAITYNTNFRLASLSKQFIAYGIIVLESQGKLNRQDTLKSYFSLEFIQRCPKISNTVRIQHLLDHSSGVMDYENNESLLEGRQWLDDDVLVTLKDETYFQPGSQFRYSNTGYILLGLIIEVVSEQALGDFLRQFIFEPFGMKTSIVFDLDHLQIVNRAFGYAEREDNKHYCLYDQSPTSATRGDGGIYMSINDYFQWYRHCQTMMSTVFSIQNELSSSAKYYSLGWFLSNENGHTRIHSGHSCGFTHQVFRIDEEQRRVLVIYLSNINANDERLANFNRLIVDRIPQLRPKDLDLLHCLKELTR
ncbi:unnamed protein product [Rotaria magnacalcarata]|uniref:Beta-lactamase-related domain-containing protein n=1 Tax=Rotaria magnacalcarata TaxID=392030 RepID=A0A815PYQ8_9BILA|nr:unnamed protein product [Rotaria magnacalcarata]CAF1456241.1 unnamed protein product [Rotaria magnacalcarata]CAF3925620.1 unnamed protein product [Rotaria magnacalcarata]CAF4086212.1 unnamed protein product [Rotaria magnacalcarata]